MWGATHPHPIYFDFSISFSLCVSLSHCSFSLSLSLYLFPFLTHTLTNKNQMPRKQNTLKINFLRDHWKQLCCCGGFGVGVCALSKSESLFTHWYLFFFFFFEEPQKASLFLWESLCCLLDNFFVRVIWIWRQSIWE